MRGAGSAERVAMPRSAENGPRLLLAEDEAAVGMLLQDMLALLGAHAVGPVASVGRALALIEAEAPRLDGAILDIKLGREDVYPVADRLRSLGLPFIFLTGYGLPAIPRCYAGTPVIEKPFELTDLEDLLRRHFPPPFHR